MSAPVHEVLGRRVAPGAAPAGDFTYSVVELAPAAWSGLERRGGKRLRTRLRDGIIGERRHGAIAECRISDRSPDGARLRLDGDRRLPQRFVLTDGAARSLFRADLVWQTGRDAGVRLTPLE